MPQPDSNLPQMTVAEARRRFRKLLRIMAAITLPAVAAALLWLWATDTPMTVHVVAAAVIAVVGSLGLAAVLMGLVFYSHTSGTDADVSHLDD